MDLKATIDKDVFGYRNRLLLIALGALIWSALCVYDALEKYPAQIERRELFESTQKNHPKDWQDRWAEVATANDWDPKEPNKRSPGDIHTQWIMFAICFPIGTYCLISVGRWSRKYIGADETTLYANGGIEVPFDKITRIDASRWERKGIAYVYYDLGPSNGNVLIDDFKFERQAADAVFNRIKNAIDANQIEGLTDDSTAAPNEVPEESQDAQA